MRVKPNRQAGFTLVEILTVLVIIGLVSSAVILTLPKKKPVLDVFAKQFLRDANVAAQESLLTGVPMALGLSEAEYAVLRYEEGDWLAQKRVSLPDIAVIRFEKDASKIDLSEDIQPVVIFEPTGQATVFRLRLSSPEQSVIFISHGDGRVVMEAGV